MGKRRLKGIPEAIKVYRMIQDPNSYDYQILLHSNKPVNEKNKIGIFIWSTFIAVDALNTVLFILAETRYLTRIKDKQSNSGLRDIC